jgi:hypothetical protein
MMQGGNYYPRQFDITPSDTVNCAYPCHAIWVGTAGDVVVVSMFGDTVTYAAVPAKSYLFGPFKKIKATNTTATNIKGLGPT